MAMAYELLIFLEGLKDILFLLMNSGWHVVYKSAILALGSAAVSLNVCVLQF